MSRLNSLHGVFPVSLLSCDSGAQRVSTATTNHSLLCPEFSREGERGERQTAAALTLLESYESRGCSQNLPYQLVGSELTTLVQHLQKSVQTRLTGHVQKSRSQGRGSSSPLPHSVICYWLHKKMNKLLITTLLIYFSLLKPLGYFLVCSSRHSICRAYS